MNESIIIGDQIKLYFSRSHLKNTRNRMRMQAS